MEGESFKGEGLLLATIPKTTPPAFRYKVIGAKKCTITTSCAQSVLPTSAKNFKEGSIFWPHVLAWFSAKREDCKFRETHSRRQQISDLRDLMCFKVSTAPALQDVPDLLKNLKRNGHKAFRTTPIDSICVHLVSYILRLSFKFHFQQQKSFLPPPLPPSFPSLFPSFLLSFRIIHASCKLTIWSDGP